MYLAKTYKNKFSSKLNGGFYYVRNKSITNKLLQEKIDVDLLNVSIEITLLNKIYKDKLIDEKIYEQAKENIIRGI